MISPADAALYRENGYVVQYDFLEPELIEEMRQACDALCAEASALTENNDYYDLEDSHSREDVRVRRLKRPTEMDSVFHRAARHPKLLDALSALIGPQIRLSHPTGKINIKAAEYGSPVEWHQDWAAYPHTNDDLLSVAIHPGDSLEENGHPPGRPGHPQGPYNHT